MLGAIAAYHKYGDRTDVTDKSLKGTKEAIDTLLAYLGRSVADAVKPTIEKILANVVNQEGIIIKQLRAADVIAEVEGEQFLDSVASFVNSDIDEILFYRNLVHARKRWCCWAKRISWGVFSLLIVQGVFTFYFALEKMLSHPVALKILLATFICSAAVVGFCIVCAGVMLRYHDQISDYRDKIL